MINKMNCDKEQNKGFTLMEVLIAITILAIIVGPLLHSFVVAAQTNAKSKQILRSTTLAQNVMEELKAYSLEDIARQFNSKPGQVYTTDTSITSLASDAAYEALVTTVDGKDVYTAVKTTADLAEGETATASIVSAADPTGKPEGCFRGQASGNYCFILENVQMESARFDMAIRINENANGSKNLVNITSMNRSDCGYYAQDEAMDGNVADEFQRRNDIYSERITSLDSSEFEDIMSREIVIDINVDISGNESVKVTYNYEVAEGYTAPENRTYSEFTTIFDNYASKEELKAVYLYYYPLYGTGRTDAIKIVNNSNKNIPVYLIKMKSMVYNAYDDAEYRPYISLLETAAGSEGKSCAKLCTNIDMTKSVNAYTVVGANLRTGDLGNEEGVECLYDVEIFVYKHDDDDTPFEESSYITSFTGSLLDNSVVDD